MHVQYEVTAIHCCWDTVRKRISRSRSLCPGQRSQGIKNWHCTPPQLVDYACAIWSGCHVQLPRYVPETKCAAPTRRRHKPQQQASLRAGLKNKTNSGLFKLRPYWVNAQTDIEQPSECVAVSRLTTGKLHIPLQCPSDSLPNQGRTLSGASEDLWDLLKVKFAKQNIIYHDWYLFPSYFWR